MRSRARVLASVAVLLACACGAEGQSAPDVARAQPCAASVLLETTLTQVHAHADDAGMRTLQRVLGEEGGALVLVRALLHIAQNSDSSTFDALGNDNLSEDTAFLGTYAEQTLTYLDETLDAPAPGPVDALHGILTSCPAASALHAAGTVLSLRSSSDGVWHSDGDGDAYLLAVADAAARALEDPDIAQAIERIALDDSTALSDGSIHVGKDAFSVLARLFAENLNAPGFDPSVFGDQLFSLLAPQLPTPAAQQQARALLDLALSPLQVPGEAKDAVVDLTTCLLRADKDGLLAGMVFDWLSGDGQGADTFITELASHGGVASTTNALWLAGDLATTLAGNAGLATDAFAMLAQFVTPTTARDSIALLRSLNIVALVRDWLDVVPAMKTCAADRNESP